MQLNYVLMIMLLFFLKQKLKWAILTFFIEKKGVKIGFKKEIANYAVKFCSPWRKGRDWSAIHEISKHFSHGNALLQSANQKNSPHRQRKK